MLSDIDTMIHKESCLIVGFSDEGKRLEYTAYWPERQLPTIEEIQKYVAEYTDIEAPSTFTIEFTLKTRPQPE